MILIMGQIEPEYPGLFALEFGKTAEYDCFHSIIYKYWPISTKLRQNVCDHKISDEFDYGSNRIRNGWVICPWIRKFAIFDFVNTLASANIDQSVPNLATILYAHKVSDEFDYGSNWTRTSRVICPWIWKNCWIWLFTLCHLQILTNQHQTWSKCMWS